MTTASHRMTRATREEATDLLRTLQWFVVTWIFKSARFTLVRGGPVRCFDFDKRHHTDTAQKIMQTGVIADVRLMSRHSLSLLSSLIYYIACVCIGEGPNSSSFSVIQDSHIQIHVSCWNNQKDLSVPYYQSQFLHALSKVLWNIAVQGQMDSLSFRLWSFIWYLLVPWSCLWSRPGDSVFKISPVNVHHFEDHCWWL